MKAAERALLFAAFSAALAFGTLIPVLPVYLSATGSESSWHVAALPVVFLAAASLSAPLWGRLSDRVPRRTVLLCGLGGTVAAVVPFLVQHSVGALYAYQAIAGLSFGAVGPVALAMLYEAAASGSEGRGVAWFNGATLAGYLTGPAVGGWTASLAVDLAAHAAVLVALAVQALLALAALLLVAMTASATVPQPALPASTIAKPSAVLAASLLAAFMIGGFEIAASLYARSPLHLGASDVAWIFMGCSAAMFLVQLVVLPRLPARAPRVRIALACITVSGVVLALMAYAQIHAVLIALAAVEGATLGLAVGVLSFDAAASGGAVRGRRLGYQNAAVNAGQAVGSAAGAAAFMNLGTAAFPALGALVVLIAALLGARSQAA
jgi:MFS transporter, DHA1 family, multidrug resistance protein